MDGFDPRSAALDLASTWLALAHADILVVGHTHVAFEVRVKGGGLLVNPGALMVGPGDPAPVVRVGVEPGDLAALPPAASAGGTFGVLDLAERQFRVHRARDGAEVEIARTVSE